MKLHRKEAPLSLSLPNIDPAVWMPILGSGIGIAVAPTTPLKSFLCEQIHIDPDYLENRIQTILINGNAIDNMDQTHISDKDVIALSAAMPGLAGTTLRRGSHLAKMRQSITHPHASGSGALPGETSSGMVVLKLFNLVAREVGNKVLDGDILIRRKDMDDLLERYPMRTTTPPVISTTPLSTILLATEDWIAVRIEACTAR